ncbi:MAG: Spy/CpxP family protein refolding chaperone [Cyanobacteria bacterium J06641_5]
MKARLIPLLVSGMAISIIVFPLNVKANPSSTATTFPALAEVQLSPSQQTELEALKEETLSQLAILLSPAQQAQLEDAVSQGDSLKSAVRSLDLSFKKKRQMRGVLQDMRSEIDKILTPEQKQQLQDAL